MYFKEREKIVNKNLLNFKKDINHAIYIKEASRDIGKALAIKDEHHIVVVKSTVVPGSK